MANEKIDTTQNIIKPPLGDSEKEKDLLAALESIPENNIMKIWAKMDEADRKKSKRLEAPQKLRDFREARKEKIQNISDEDKEKIIRAAEKIPVEIEIDNDGSRLIVFKLWNKTYKILDPRLNNHTDNDYRWIVDVNNNTVLLEWMKWDDLDWRKNNELRKYVKQKESKGLHIAKVEEIKTLLEELWKQAKLCNEWDLIPMLMYLTWMDWSYWLSMWDHRKSDSKASSRSVLNCDTAYPGLWFRYTYFNDYSNASLCMISCK